MPLPAKRLLTNTRLLPATKPKKNMIPPFTDSRWTLHENTRMKQANFVGKVRGSTAENPHIAKYAATTSLITTASGTEMGLSSAIYTGITTLGDGALSVVNNSTNGNISQHLFSFNLIEHVLRNYGASVFGSAVTVADRVAWLKANISSLRCNWHGYGSGPAGNKATMAVWDSASWISGANSHTQSTVTKIVFLTNTAPTINIRIQSDGFIHYLAYADASDGVTASTINTDFVELEVVMAKGSIPQPDYALTLNATTAFAQTEISFPALPNTQYTIKGDLTGSGARIYVHPVDGVGVESAPLGFISDTIPFVTVTTPSNTVKLRVKASNTVAGLFTFTNPQLEPGSVKTDFEPYIAVPDNKPAPMKPKKNYINLSKYVVGTRMLTAVSPSSGSITVNFGATSTFYSEINEDKIPLVPNTTYTFSALQTMISSSVTRGCTVLCYDIGGNFINETSTIYVMSGIVTKTFVTPANIAYAVMRYARGGLTEANVVVNYDGIQLEPGSVATDFEPYKPVPDNKPAKR